MTGTARLAVPPVVADLAEVIGWESAAQLVRATGGQRLYVLESMPDDHKIVRAIGREKADIVSRHFHRVVINIPSRLMRELTVREMASRQPPANVNDIAEATGLSYRSVQIMLRALESSPRQLSLFD